MKNARTRTTFAAAALMALCAPTLAGEDVQKEIEADVILRALVDELDRGRTGIQLADMERPYFIEYALLDVASASVSAELGAVTTRSEGRSRWLRNDVRVGSYQLDNANFGRGAGSGGGRGGASIPIEDDYTAIRQAIWWATDRSYKDVLETFAQKKAFMESKMIKDKPDDFSRESPTVHFEPRIDVPVELTPLTELVVKLSGVFKDYPQVQDSGANLQLTGGARYLVNTEDTRLRTSRALYSLNVGVTVQADDGMKLSDAISLFAPKLADIPPVEELDRRCRELAEQVIEVKNAPRMEESYSGPVLFDAEAATAIFMQEFGGRLTGGQRPVGTATPPDDFSNKLGKRVLPRWMNVVDDPTRPQIDGEFVAGNYAYDDQGVPARPVTLVEAGRLKALLMSRNPSKEFKSSTGNGRGPWSPAASVGCLIVSAEQGLDEAALKKELIEAFQDEDLAYGLRVSSLGAGGGRSPLRVFKVHPDGREELVRGLEIGRIDLKAFKRILAAGSRPYVVNNASGVRTTAAVPALLFEELDLSKIDRDFDQPPILPSPLARKE